MLPIAAEGWGFILVPLVLALLLAWAGWIKVALALGMVAAFMAFFFRDPERTAPPLPGAILAPADGRVVDVRSGVDDPFVGAAQAVSIFLSPLDVHVNRSPLAGLVVGRAIPSGRQDGRLPARGFGAERADGHRHPGRDGAGRRPADRGRAGAADRVPGPAGRQARQPASASA